MKLEGSPYAAVDPDSLTKRAINQLANGPRYEDADRKIKRERDIGINDFISLSPTIKHPVHAEMQLLFHYESRRSGGLPPRIICSNKQACFFCNLFFLLHERFLIPNSHGRLYEKWALPIQVVTPGAFPDNRISHTIKKFAQAIENRIEKEINDAIRRKLYPPPYESAIFASASQTTVNSRARTGFAVLGGLNSQFDGDISAARGSALKALPDHQRLSLESNALVGDNTVLDSIAAPEEKAQNDKAKPLQPANCSSRVNGTTATEVFRKSGSSAPSPDPKIHQGLSTGVSSSTSLTLSSGTTSPNSRSIVEEANNLHSGHDTPIKLEKGVTLTLNLSPSKPLILHTPKMHLTFSCQPPHDTQGIENPDLETSYAAIFEWLPEQTPSEPSATSAFPAQRQVIDIGDLPQGLQQVIEFAQKRWPRGLCLRRGEELVNFACRPVGGQ